MEPEVQTRWIGADSILYATAHRPWPLPQGQWVMTQTWHDLLFAHYRVPVAALRQLVPWPLALDLYGGEAWLSVTPFWIASLRPPGIPPLPKLSQFCELNVRTYVSYGGKPGVFFFSLDAASLSAVWGARTFYRLPYWHASMRVEGNQEIRYQSRRLHGPAAASGMPRFRAVYRPGVQPRAARRGSIEEFLTERYCLYAWNRGKLYRAEIHHLPWPLQPVETEIELNTMAEPLGLSLPLRPDLAQFSRLLKVLVWAPEKLPGLKS
ncbi:MAG: DUF2071 domain-containing protein [Candidatus Korobacteraceae bacterium]